MDERPSRSSQKRPFIEEDDSNKPPAQKRVRFPKGKKVKSGDYVVDPGPKPSEDVPSGFKDPRLAAKERAMRRNQITADLLEEEQRGMISDISQAEVQYQDNETFVDDGIQIEPFNLRKEREEGYFDQDGNYVEYVNEKEIKDAWLDSVDFDKNLAGKISTSTSYEDAPDLSSEDLGKIKRRIADALQPGETVLQALRRLKGSSGNKREKMSAETKQFFDQLTEDAMKLLENGEFNVYDERKESFQREAEGYEKLAQARDQGISNSYASSDAAGDDAFDIFADDDDKATAGPASHTNGSIANNGPDNSSQPSGSGDLQNDYVYDDTSGYYYSSSSGYYYDPSSGLYCCAASGQWYSYNQETGTYDEVQQQATASTS